MKRAIVIMCASILVWGCNKKGDSPITISVKSDSPDIALAQLYTADTTYTDSLHQGYSCFTIPASKSGYVTLDMGQSIPLYVESADSICIKISGDEVLFSGLGYEESEFLHSKNKLIDALGFNDPRKIDIALFSSEPEVFVHKIDSVKRLRTNQLKEAENLSEPFILVEQQLIKYFGVNQLFGYPSFHEMLTGSKPSLPNNYFDFTNSVEPNRAELYQFKDYQQAIRSLLSHRAQTFAQKYALAKELITDTSFFEEIMFWDLYSYINFNGTHDIDSICKEFMALQRNGERKEALLTKYQGWQRLAKGEVAPDFEISNEKGKPVRLSDFRGKVVYIDCWSSFCGPCISEMPAMRDLIAAFKGRNVVFISISADTDTQRWLSKVKEFGLDAVNLCTQGANHKFNQDYMAKAFPRYILINSEGIIVNAAANKPSEAKPQIEALL